MPSEELPETQPQFDFDDDETDVENLPTNGDLLQKPVAFLIFDEKGANEKRHPIYGDGETIIGRDPLQCQIAIDRRHADIATVSRVHAKIFYEKGTHFIETLSTNSNTKMNKASLINGRIYAITDGTLLTFGTVQARYSLNTKNADHQEERYDDITDHNVSNVQLNATIDPNLLQIEEHDDSALDKTHPVNGDDTRISYVTADESVTSPTTALATSVVKETPQSADKVDGLHLRLVESSPDESEQMNTSDIRTKLNYSANAGNLSMQENPLSVTQDMFQTSSSPTAIQAQIATPPPVKAQESEASIDEIVPPLRRLANITPMRAISSPLATDRSEAAAVIENSAMDVDPVDSEKKKKTDIVADPPPPQRTPTDPVKPDDPKVSPQRRSSRNATPKTKWTPSVEMAALIKGHEELNSIPDILKSYTPRKKPDQEYDFDSDSQGKRGESSEEKEETEGTPKDVARTSRTKKEKEKVKVVSIDAKVSEDANMTPPTSALRKYRFEYFDPKSTSGKRRSSRTPKVPAVSAKKTPKTEKTTPASGARSTGRKRRVAKETSEESDEEVSFEKLDETIASDTTTPMRRSTRNMKRIQYAQAPSSTESDSDDNVPLIALVPKKASTASRNSSATKPKRAKMETETELTKTKEKKKKKEENEQVNKKKNKKEETEQANEKTEKEKQEEKKKKDKVKPRRRGKKKSVEVVEEVPPSAESSSDDNAPLIAFRRSASRASSKEAKETVEEKQRSTTSSPLKRPAEDTDDSPISPDDRKSTPVRRSKKMKVVLKTLKEDVPSSPLHTPVDRRRIRQPERKFRELADESIALDDDDAIVSSTPAVSSGNDTLSDHASDQTPATPKLQRIISQTTPNTTPRSSAFRQNGTRTSIRIKSGSDDVGILLSSACMQDEELLKIAEQFGEAKSICEATHFVANQARRTSKLVASVARGIPIVTSEWLYACKRKGKIVDAKEYILSGDIAGCDLNNAIEKSRNGWLSLDGWTIARTLHAEPSAEEMSEVVKAAGGTLVDSLTDECSLLVAHTDDRDDPLVKSAVKRRIPIVQGRMLYQAILEHNTDFKNPRLALKF